MTTATEQPLQTFTPRDGQTIKDQIAAFRQGAAALVSAGVTADTYERLGEVSRAGAALVKNVIRPYWEADCKAADQLHKSLVAKRNADVAMIDDIVGQIDQALIAYRVEQKRIADIAAARLAAEEKQLQDAVALEQAAALHDCGEPDQAAAVLEEAVATPAPYVAPAAAPKLAGLTFVAHFDVFVEQAHLVPRDLCTPHEGLIKARVKATGGAPIPGVRIKKTERPVKRGA